MTRTIRLSVALSVVGLLAVTAPTTAQTWTDLEIGVQRVDVSGNDDMYRTQLNERDGLVIKDFSVLVANPDGAVFDRFRIDASGFGGNPAGRFRLRSDLGDLYSLSVDFRQFDLFTAVPGWANPAGGETAYHTADRSRTMLDVELELLPGRVVTPIIGYRWNEVDGPRRTTYHRGQDEFRLSQSTRETESELRVGAAFRAGTFRGMVVQGWREFESDTSAALLDGAGAGLNGDPVLGSEVALEDLQRATRTDADTPVTSAYVSGLLFDRLKLDVSFVRADVESETSSVEALTGSLVSFEIARYFAGLDESIESRTDNPSWRGAVDVTLDLTPQVAVDFAYERRHREQEGWAMISSLYLDTLNFSGFEPGDVLDLVEVRNAYERDDDRARIALRVHDLGPFFGWAGYSLTDSDIDLAPDVAQIVVAGGQGGRFAREIDGVEVGAGLRFGSFRAVVDYRSDDADEAVMRTDFLDRSRLGARLQWRPVGWLDIAGTVETIESENATPGIDYLAETDHWALDLDLEASDSLRFHVAWDAYETESTLLIRRPQDFGAEPSVHLEDAEMFEGGLHWNPNPFHLSFGASVLDNTGAIGFQLEREYARVGYDFSDSIGASFEFEHHKYVEDLAPSSGFEVDRLGLFVRFRN